MSGYNANTAQSMSTSTYFSRVTEHYARRSAGEHPEGPRVLGPQAVLAESNTRAAEIGATLGRDNTSGTVGGAPRHSYTSVLLACTLI
jgi:hypothetical protein